MRPILFRAWDKKREKFFTSPLWVEFQVNKDGVLTAKNISPPMDGGKYQELEIMQYTGLNDINNVRIYEGDIVKSTFHSGIDNATTDIYVVEHDNINPCFVMQSITSEYQREYDFVQVDLRTNEVIGNIYENQELLKDSK